MYDDNSIEDEPPTIRNTSNLARLDKYIERKSPPAESQDYLYLHVCTGCQLLLGIAHKDDARLWCPYCNGFRTFLSMHRWKFWALIGAMITAFIGLVWVIATLLKY